MVKDILMFIVGIVFSSGILALAGKTYIKKVIETRFEKQLQYAQFDFQRKVHDFSLFTNKRHEIYPQIYSQLLLNKSKVFSLRGMTTLLTFEEYNEQDIRHYMEGYRVPEGFIREILDLWTTQHKHVAVSRLRAYINMLEKQEAENELGISKGKVLENGLYLSDKVSESCNEITQNMNNLYYNYVYPNDDTCTEENDNIKKQIDERLEQLKKEMKQEISIGDYE